MKNHSEENYCITYAELVEFIENYGKKHRRFVIGTEEAVDLILNKGIFKKNGNSKYTFRLKGVFEYFLAYYLKDDNQLRNEIIETNTHYLSFGNEFEFVAGFNKKDADFLQKILAKSKAIFDPVNSNYEKLGNTDEVFIQKTTSINIKLSNYKKGILTLSKKKEIYDELSPLNNTNSEVTKKQVYENITPTADNLEKVLFILSRVFRNSTVDNDKLNNEALDFILESACNLCFLIVDEKDSVQEFDENFFKIFTNFIPLVIQGFLYDAVAQNNLENILIDKIKELKQHEGNELKVFALYYILVDLDIKTNKKYIREAISFIKINSLKHASLFKLFSYLLFHKYTSAENKTYIEQEIISQARSIDRSKKNIDSVVKTIRNLSLRDID